jgi:sporulation protein YlmC with PRC-barrel domain
MGRHGIYTLADSNGPGPRLMGVDTLMGNEAYKRQDEDLGDIKELMLNVADGRISYPVLSYSGLLDMGDKLFAVPWGALTLYTDNKRLNLDVSKDRLVSAPGFDKDHRPNMSDQTWAKDIHSCYWPFCQRFRNAKFDATASFTTSAALMQTESAAMLLIVLFLSLVTWPDRFLCM